MATEWGSRRVSVPRPRRRPQYRSCFAPRTPASRTQSHARSLRCRGVAASPENPLLRTVPLHTLRTFALNALSSRIARNAAAVVVDTWNLCRVCFLRSALIVSFVRGDTPSGGGPDPPKEPWLSPSVAPAVAIARRFSRTLPCGLLMCPLDSEPSSSTRGPLNSCSDRALRNEPGGCIRGAGTLLRRREGLTASFSMPRVRFIATGACTAGSQYQSVRRARQCTD